MATIGQRMRPRHPAVLVCNAGALVWLASQAGTSSSLGFQTYPHRVGYRRKPCCSSWASCSRPRSTQARASSWLLELPARAASSGPLAPLTFGLAYVLTLCLAAPATPLTLSAGYLFGLLQGFSIAMLAGSFAGSICFLLARTLLRPWVTKLAAGNEALNRLNRAVELRGFQIIFLLRLSPLVHFSILSYACGLSRVKFTSFLCANILGFAPCTFAFACLGSSARKLVESGARLPWPCYAVAAILTAVLMLLATKVAQRALARSAEQ
eukprot:TRINITY_DN34025_c0_g1_i1.p1 TRINITY_DN34025_c0_g1~~TRINITY_DN34025_c0_g1_i1.p1  ORF type:complete len:276 (+),score=16.95 TRINITY_DN34025_c0_g1_i1:30-830(+)